MKESLCCYEKGREKAIRTEIKKYICILSNDVGRKDVIVMSIAEIYYYFYYYTTMHIRGYEREVDITW